MPGRMVAAYREFMWRNHWIRQLLGVFRWTAVRLCLITFGVAVLLIPIMNVTETAVYAVTGPPATARVERCQEMPSGRGGATMLCWGTWTFADGRTDVGWIHHVPGDQQWAGQVVPVRANRYHAAANPFAAGRVVFGLPLAAVVGWYAWWSSPRRRRTAR